MYNSNRIIEEYQQKVANKLFGMIVEVVLKQEGIDPSIEMISYVYTLVKLYNKKSEKGDIVKYLQVPVQYLFSCITPFSPEDYDKTTFRKYMAKFTKLAIEPLQDIITVTGYGEDYCRRFMISESLLEKINEKGTKYMKYNLPPVDQIKPNVDVGLKPAKWGGRELTVKELPEVTKAAWRKLKFSKFRFDWDLFWSDKGRIFNRSLNLNRHQNIALISALDDIQQTSKPQYHASYYIQRPGRLHTRGGPMALTSPFRRFYIKPTKPGNVCLEIDLKCAQLLVLCEILKATSVKEQILEIIQKDSIWNHISPINLDKKVKKVIVYGFCFGAKMYELPFLATTKAKSRYNLDCKVTSKDIDAAFSGILKPLVNLRNIWLSQYTLFNIENNQIDKVIHTNSLGLSFNLIKEAENYKKSNRGKVDEFKVASQLLANYCQSYEQLIIQSMIANSIEENILTYSYDGLTIEVSESKVDVVKRRLDKWIENNYKGYLIESEVYR